METINEYEKTDQKLFERISARMGDNLRFYCATGSYGRNKILPGWSDIDILLVLREYGPTTFAEIGQTLNELRGPIKIGLTIFSVEEFTRPSPKSSRTCLAINAILDGKFTPRLQAPEIQLTYVPIAAIRTANKTEFARVFHDLKREMLRLQECDERKICKFMTIILKIILQEREICADSYEDVSDSMLIFKELGFEFVTPEEILKHPEKKSKRFLTYIDFVQKISANVETIFLAPGNAERVAPAEHL